MTLLPVLLVWNPRSQREPLLRLGLFSNRRMLVWAAATVMFVLVATLAPGARTILSTARLNHGQWALVIALAVAGTFWIAVRKWLARTP